MKGAPKKTVGVFLSVPKQAQLGFHDKGDNMLQLTRRIQRTRCFVVFVNSEFLVIHDLLVMVGERHPHVIGDLQMVPAVWGPAGMMGPTLTNAWELL